MRFLKPEKIIEVGSGFSSALMLDTNDLFLKNNVNFTFIEPFPHRLRKLLKEKDLRTTRIVVEIVQSLPVSTFSDLGFNDILFIDSSHVSKCGSDVNHLLFEVLPALKAGVVVHFHDIGWPFEYSEEWILNDMVFNEAYMIRAFLQYNRNFKILIFNAFAHHSMKSFLEKNMPLFLTHPVGSLWLRKVS